MIRSPAPETSRSCQVECLAADGRPLAHIEARPFDPAKGDVPVNEWVTSSSAALPSPRRYGRRPIHPWFHPADHRSRLHLLQEASAHRGQCKSTNLLTNPELRPSDTTLPGWTVEGAIETGDQNHRGGATALRLGPGEPASATRSIKDWKVGQKLRFEAWSKVLPGSRGRGDSFTMEVVQIDRRGRAIDTQTRTAGVE